MPQIQKEQRGGITVRYIDVGMSSVSSDERFTGRKMRVYLLPGVPMDAGEIPKMPDVPDLKDTINEMFKSEHRATAERIGREYSGRQIDALSILKYAEGQGSFNEFAKRLDDEMKGSITYMHPDIRYARTDVTAFFMELYADLGIAPRAEAVKQRKIVDDYGAGLVILVDQEGPNQKPGGGKTPKKPASAHLRGKRPENEAEKTLPKVSVADFRLDALLNGEIEAVYFRTESGNIYHIDKTGRMEGSADRSRGWEPINVNLNKEARNRIVVGERFHVSGYDGEEKVEEGRNTTEVTEIVYLAITDVAGPAALVRPSKPSIVEDFRQEMVET